MEEIEEEKKEEIVVLDEGLSMEEIAKNAKCCDQASASIR